MTEDFTPRLTPVERFGRLWLKRDDLYSRGGIQGGKVRACWRLAVGARGLVTASARKSPQMQIVARLAALMAKPCRLHTATGQHTEEMVDAVHQGADLVQHKPGYNSVICARAERDAIERGWTYIPFGMEHKDAMDCTRQQVESIETALQSKHPPKRIVVCLGSGMTAAGILWGLRDRRIDIPLVGVRIGADPTKRLNKWAPCDWPRMMKIETSRYKYHEAVNTSLGQVLLDAHYEAKCTEFLKNEDLFWIVGIRAGITHH